MPPKVLQLEVTNRCNFSCAYCIRNYWRAKLRDMELSLFRRAVESVDSVERVDLYGFGEPLLNPELAGMVREASRRFSDAEMFLSTNGSMTDEETVERLFQLGLNSISFSVDTPNPFKLERIRRGAAGRRIRKNLLSALRIKKKFDTSVGIEVVVTEENYSELPELISQVIEEGVDFITVTHVIPYNREVYKTACYLGISGPSLELLESVADEAEEVIYRSVVELLGVSHFTDYELSNYERYGGLWDMAVRRGYWINFPLLLSQKDRISLARRCEKLFETCRKKAKEYGVLIDLPSVFPDAKNRSCRYMEREAVFIRSDGLVVPCMEFAYSHDEVVNNHVKEVHKVVMGDLRRSSISDIWDSENYRRFRSVRRDLPRNIPWCGDCVYSSLDCWYVQSNELDCYSNTNTCNECLYSVDIAKCVI